MAHHYIPFANSDNDWPVVSSLYSESAGCRVTLQSVQKGTSAVLPGLKLWVDAEVDGLQSPEILADAYEINTKYKKYVSKFENWELIANPEFQRSPDKEATIAFVRAALNTATAAVPNLRWLSVPQLPYTDGPDRNKINRFLANAALRWKMESRRSVQLILPVIFAKNSGQTDSKTNRNKKVDLAVSCFEASGADGVWVVDSTLDDLLGVSNFEDVRFPGLIKFHEELNAKLPPKTRTVAGPYWGLNLVLWARGLVGCPAIGTGRSYRYYLPGGFQKEGDPRIALPPLRRLAVCSPGLKTWLEEVTGRLSKGDPVHENLLKLLQSFDTFYVKNRARRQVADFYKDWLGKLESVSGDTRGLTLYQDFSSAFVLGKKLKHPIPRPEKVRSAALIAKQFMVNCL